MITLNYRTVSAPPVQPPYIADEAEDEWPVEDVLWQPNTFVPKLKPKPELRSRDYIIIEAPEPENPFEARVGVALKLAESVGRDFGLDPEAVCGSGRHKPLVHARAVIAMLLKQRGWSYPQIAKAVGRRDHSTIHHAIASFDIYCKINPTVLESYNRHLSLMAEALSRAA